MIRVAKDGYAGTVIPSHGLLYIDGVLHRLVCLVSGPDVWVPVGTYCGDVQHVDSRGRPVADHPTAAKDGGRRDG